MADSLPIAGAPFADLLDRCVRCGEALTDSNRAGPAELCVSCCRKLFGGPFA